MNSLDPMDVIASDLRQRQLQAMQQHMPHVYDGHAARMAAYTEDGVGSMNSVLDASGIGAEQIERCLRFAEEDPRFGFLNVIPSVAVLTVARSRALDQGLNGTTLDAVAEMGLLLSLYTILLDGLMDEVPEALAPDAGMLVEVMTEQEWAATGVPPSFPSQPERHPITELLCDVTTEIIRRAVTSEGWRADFEVRRRFAEAARTAFVAEAASVTLTMNGGPPSDVPGFSDRLRAKSIHWAVVTALAPLCVRGRPSGVDLDAYEAFARAVGVFGGWIDDVADVLPDLRDKRWSNVLLEVLARTPWQPGADLRTALAYRLADETLVEGLATSGVRLYDDAMARLQRLPLAPEPLAAVLADIAQCALETDSSE